MVEMQIPAKGSEAETTVPCSAFLLETGLEHNPCVCHPLQDLQDCLLDQHKHSLEPGRESGCGFWPLAEGGFSTLGLHPVLEVTESPASNSLAKLRSNPSLG